jgi:hypothetical protein
MPLQGRSGSLWLRWWHSRARRAATSGRMPGALKAMERQKPEVCKERRLVHGG